MNTTEMAAALTAEADVLEARARQLRGAAQALSSPTLGPRTLRPRSPSSFGVSARIIACLESSDLPMAPRDVANVVGHSPHNTGVLMKLMSNAGRIHRVSYGLYQANALAVTA